MTSSNDNLELILFGWVDALRRRDPAPIAGSWLAGGELVLGVGVERLGAGLGAEVVVALAVSAVRSCRGGIDRRATDRIDHGRARFGDAAKWAGVKIMNDDAACPPRTVFDSVTSSAVASASVWTLNW